MMTPVPAQQIAIGTAQFGLDYGITNASGQVGAPEVTSILQTARDSGITLLDTAAAYGTSEEVLGQALGVQIEHGGQGLHSWRLVTKTLPVRKPAITAADLAAVSQRFDASLANLDTDSVDTLLIHHAQDLLVPGGQALHDWLLRQKESGRARRIGVSIYSGDEAARLLEKYTFDVVQLPASIADQRLLKDGTVAALARAGVELHVRSIYLQGLLLAEPAFVAARFPAQAAWAAALRSECQARGLSPAAACLSFFRSQSLLGVAVIGVTRADELQSLVAAWQQAPAADWSSWAVNDTAFTDPREWNKA